MILNMILIWQLIHMIIGNGFEKDEESADIPPLQSDGEDEKEGT